jgi:hypothetical protein
MKQDKTSSGRTTDEDPAKKKSYLKTGPDKKKVRPKRQTP